MSIIFRKSFEYNENSFYQITCKKDIFQAVSPWVYEYSDLTKQNIPILLQSDTFQHAKIIHFSPHLQRNLHDSNLNVQIKILQKLDKYVRILTGLIEDDKIYEETKKFVELKYSNICRFDHPSIDIKKLSYATKLSPEQIFEFGLKIKEPNFIFYNFAELIKKEKYSIEYLNDMIEKTVDYFEYLIPKNIRDFLQFCVDFEEKHMYVGAGLKSPCNWEFFGLYVSFLYVHNETKNFKDFWNSHNKISIKDIFSVFLRLSFNDSETKIIEEFIIKYPDAIVDLIDLNKCFNSDLVQYNFEKLYKFLDLFPDSVFNIKFLNFSRYRRNNEQYKYLMQRLKKQKDNKELIEVCILESLENDSWEFLVDIVKNSVVEKASFFLNDTYVDEDPKGYLINVCHELNIIMEEDLVYRYFYGYYRPEVMWESKGDIWLIKYGCKKWSLRKILDNLFELIEESYPKNRCRMDGPNGYKNLCEELALLRGKTIPLNDYFELKKNYPLCGPEFLRYFERGRY